MKEKYRIGDGKNIERSSMAPAASQTFNDGASLMFDTGQAFFNPVNNVFTLKGQGTEQMQLPPL